MGEGSKRGIGETGNRREGPGTPILRLQTTIGLCLSVSLSQAGRTQSRSCTCRKSTEGVLCRECTRMAVAGLRGLSGSEARRTRRFASTGTPWRTGRAALASILRASSLHGVLLARMRTAQSPDEGPKRSFFCGREVTPTAQAARSRPSSGMRSELARTSSPLRRSPLATRSPRHGVAVDQAAMLRPCQYPRQRASIRVH